jgi:hypothetical protein
MVFAVGEKTPTDIKKKTPRLIKKTKGYKIPKDAVTQVLVHKVEYGMANHQLRYI